MPRTIRYHLDENCHHGIAHALRRYGIDVSTTPETKLWGATDDELLCYAVSERRVIFIRDKGFLRLAGQGVQHPGVVYCRQQSLSIGEIIKALVLIWEVYEADDLKDKVEYI